MTNGEGIDKARAHILEGLQWMNEVPLRSKARAADVVARGIDFNEMFEYLDKLRSSYQALEREKLN